MWNWLGFWLSGKIHRAVEEEVHHLTLVLLISLFFFLFFPKVHLEVLKFFHSTGTPDIGRNPPPAKLTFKSKSCDLRNIEEKIFKLFLLRFVLFSELLLVKFYRFDCPPCRTYFWKAPLSPSYTSPNHHSPRLVGKPSTKLLHSKQKLGLEKLSKICLFIYFEPIFETWNFSPHPTPTHPTSPVGRKETSLTKMSTFISKVTTWDA